MIPLTLYENNNEYTLLYLDSKDIEEENPKHIGFGFEILILPFEYKYINKDYLSNMIIVVKARNGKILYI